MPFEQPFLEAASSDAGLSMFARVAVSVAVAFLGASPLGKASGLLELANSGNSNPASFIMVSGLVLFFATICTIGPTLRLIAKIIETLKQVEERPKPAVALTMLGLGALCSISAMVVQYNAGVGTPSGFSMNMNGITANPQMTMQTSSSLGLGILTFLTFLLGAALIALGLWASLKPATPTTKPSEVALAEVPA